MYKKTCVHIDTNTYTCTDMRIYTHAHTYAHIHTGTHLHIYTCTHMHTRTHPVLDLSYYPTKKVFSGAAGSPWEQHMRAAEPF